ncbi:unnamed protein product [Mucor fragilis]
MSSGQEEDALINDELFHLYLEYQLCKVKKNRPSIWNADNTEKDALVHILTQCQNINGNTLHSVMKDIFENSIAKYTDSNSSMTIHPTPDMNSSKSKIPQVIVNTTEDDDDDTDSEAGSRQVVRSSVYTQTDLLYKTNINFDNAAVSRRNILPSSTPRRGRSLTPSRMERKKEKRTEEEKGTEEEKADENQIIGTLLNASNVKEIDRMAYEVEKTKAVLTKRIYTINDSFLINLSSTIPDTFSVLNNASCPCTTMKDLYRCQENLIGYRFGKLIERLYQENSGKEACIKAKQYYGDLQRRCIIPRSMSMVVNTCIGELKRQGRTYHATPWKQFKSYSGKMAQLVDEFGIYCLFMPEILSPTKFKRVKYITHVYG